MQVAYWRSVMSMPHAAAAIAPAAAACGLHTICSTICKSGLAAMNSPHDSAVFVSSHTRKAQLCAATAILTSLLSSPSGLESCFPVSSESCADIETNSDRDTGDGELDGVCVPSDSQAAASIVLSLLERPNDLLGAKACVGLLRCFEDVVTGTPEALPRDLASHFSTALQHCVATAADIADRTVSRTPSLAQATGYHSTGTAFKKHVLGLILQVFTPEREAKQQIWWQICRW